MKVTVKMKPNALGTLSKAQRLALSQTGEQLLGDLRNSNTMPFDTGNMQNDQTYVDHSKALRGSVSVVTDAPQARRLYFHPEYDFQRGKNPNAGAGWFDPYIDGNKAVKVRQWFKQMFKRNGGGYVG